MFRLMDLNSHGPSREQDWEHQNAVMQQKDREDISIDMLLNIIKRFSDSMRLASFRSHPPILD